MIMIMGNWEGGGPPAPWWLCVLLTPLLPVLVILALLPFTIIVVLPFAVLLDSKRDEVNSC